MSDGTPNRNGDATGQGPPGGERRHTPAKSLGEYKVFVGGISWHMDDKELKKTFKEFRAIDARVMLDRQTQRSRGFGFVHFADKGDMDDAVHALHGTEIDGRKISVTRAIPQSETAPGTPAAALARGPPRAERSERRHERSNGGYDRGGYDRGGDRYDRDGYERGSDRNGYARGSGYDRGGYAGGYGRASAYDRGSGYDRPARGGYNPGHYREYSDYDRSYHRSGGRDPYDNGYSPGPDGGYPRRPLPPIYDDYSRRGDDRDYPISPMGRRSGPYERPIGAGGHR